MFGYVLATLNRNGWEIVFSLFKSLSKQSETMPTIWFETIIDFFGQRENISVENFSGSLTTVLFITTSPTINSIEAIRAMSLLNILFDEALRLSQQQTHLTSGENKTLINNVADEAEVWKQYWLPVLSGFRALCVDMRQDVRNHAMTFLQRTLLSSHIQFLSPQAWRNCFQQVLFPLLTDLLTSFSNNDIEETRLRASVLLSKIFLQYLPKLTLLDDFLTLWLEILSFFERYIKADFSDRLAEEIPEALKNIMLVMSATGIFKGDANGQEIWDLSWKTIDCFCPHLKADFLSKAGPVLGVALAETITTLKLTPTLIEISTDSSPNSNSDKTNTDTNTNTNTTTSADTETSTQSNNTDTTTNYLTSSDPAVTSPPTTHESQNEARIIDHKEDDSDDNNTLSSTISNFISTIMMTIGGNKNDDEIQLSNPQSQNDNLDKKDIS